MFNVKSKSGVYLIGADMKLVEYDQDNYLVERTLRLTPGDKLCTVDVIELVDDELV